MLILVVPFAFVQQINNKVFRHFMFRSFLFCGSHTNNFILPHPAHTQASSCPHPHSPIKSCPAPHPVALDPADPAGPAVLPRECRSLIQTSLNFYLTSHICLEKSRLPKLDSFLDKFRVSIIGLLLLFI